MHDVIGTLYTLGTYDTEGNELTPAVSIPGWHVNSPTEVIPWQQYKVTPATPRRVFAGHDTFCYVFPDEETFNALTQE